MSFTTVNLTGERVLVKGTDRFGTAGEVVLDASEWLDVQRRVGFTAATEDFDAAVERFFAPLMDAADKLESTFKKPALDPIAYVTIHEGTEEVQGRDEVTIKLGHDSIVLRLIDQGETDRLVWVMDQLEVMAVEELPTDVAGDAGVAPEVQAPGNYEG